jgi:cell division septation protein DedD
MGSHDTEITLGTGKMLGIFFGLVALCGVFLGLGYSLGRAGAYSTWSGNEPAQTTADSGTRPAVTKSDAPATQTGDLTFYKAVEQKDANAQLPANGAPAVQTPAVAAMTPSPATEAAQSAPVAPDPMTVTGAAYFVQVAALRKPDDAQALVGALKKKQYSAFSTNNSSTDKLFRVQIGPFAALKDAEAIKAKLISDGYNPIVKK